MGSTTSSRLVLRAYGFRSYDSVTTALYHAVGELPEPKFVHQFWSQPSVTVAAPPWGYFTIGSRTRGRVSYSLHTSRWTWGSKGAPP